MPRCSALAVRREEERHKYKRPRYATADIVCNEADGEGENEGVGLSVPKECTYLCSELLEERSKLTTFINS